MNTEPLTFHPASDLFPLMEGTDLENLIQDIRDHGLREPITLHPDGSILDGRNRYRACLQLQIEPASVIWVALGSPVEYVLSLNLHRRHLTPSQLSMVALKAKPLLEQEARERQRTAGKPPLDPDGSKGKANKLAGEAVGVGAEHVRCANTVVERGIPELAEAVRVGQVGVRVAAEVASLPIDEQRRLVAEGAEAMRQAAHPQRSSKPKEEPSAEPETKSEQAPAGTRRLPKQNDLVAVHNYLHALEGVCLGLGKLNTSAIIASETAALVRKELAGVLKSLRKFYRSIGGNGEPH